MIRTGFAAVSLTLASTGLPCCVASDGTSVRLSGERVIIIWDSAHHIQHFIREAKFDTAAKDFGFIVPTPSIPALAKVDPEAFNYLEGFVPKDRSKGMRTGGAGAPGDAVEILQSERVGDYQATVVRAASADSMNSWLKANGYISRPAMRDWLAYYVKRKWIFTAFKFLKDEPTGKWTQAIRLSFKTDLPHYPYKMPTDTWPGNWYRPLRVYVVAKERMEGRFQDSDSLWNARTAWAGTLPDDVREGLARDLKLKTSDIPQDSTLTVLQNSEEPSGFAHDLFFVPFSATASTRHAPR